MLATRGTWWVVPALLLQGLFVNALFGAMHESVHYGSFKTRRIADLLAFFSGAAILNNAGFYRHYHMAHHRYTQDPARDPELVTSGTPRTWGHYLFRVSSIPFLMLRMRDIFLFPFGYRGDVNYIHPSAWPEARRWGRWLLALYVVLIVGSIALQTDVVLWVWFIPLLIGLPLLRLYLMCEHTLCPNSRRRLRQHPHDAQQSHRALPDVEPALPRRASPAAQHRLPPPARGAPPSAAAPEVRRQGLRRQCSARSCGAWRERQRPRPMKTTEGIFDCGDLPLQRGGTLKGARIVYKTFGTLSPGRDNVIVYPTSYCAQHTDIEWLVDVRALPRPQPLLHRHPQHVHQRPVLLAVEHAHGVGGEFPEVTTYDNVTQQRRLLNELFGVERVKMVYGWSMGAQQAYHWAALFGDVGRAHRRQLRLGQDRAAQLRLPRGRAHRGAGRRRPRTGLRAMGRIYAGWALSQTFYRREMWRGLGFKDLEDFLVRSWEAGFVRREAADLLAQLWTWQAGDISANDLYRGDLQMALAGIKAKVLLMPSATDLYFQTDDNAAELPHLKYARLVEIPSVWGHRAGNPLANPEDAAFIDKQVAALLAE